MTSYRLTLLRALALVATYAVSSGGLLLGFAPAAHAGAGTTFYVEAGGDDTNDCLTEVSACQTIGHALDKAVNANGDVVQVGTGTFDEGITVNKSVTIIGAGEGATIITNDAAYPNGTIVTVGSGAGTVVISGVTINHQAGNTGPDTAHGVAIETNAVVIIENSSVAFNGGEGILLTDGEVQLTAATVAGNGRNGIATSATSGKAPKVFIQPGSFVSANGSSGVQLSAGELRVDHATINQNAATGITASGAATSVDVVNGSSITSNVDNGLQIQAGSGSVTDSTINGNGSSALGGGGINCTATNGDLAISRSTIAGNGTSGVSFSGHALAVTASTVSGNGGEGIDAQAGALDVTASTIAGNAATGVAIATGTTAPQIYQSTIAGNGSGSATASGLTYDGRAAVRVGATIIANNAHGDCSVDGDGASIIDVGYNLSGDSLCAFSATRHSISDTNPMLGALANYGGPTQTMLPAASSPVVDVITPGPVALRGAGGAFREIPDPAATGFCAAGTSDQRGIARPGNLKCDIGAVEIEHIADNGGGVRDGGSPSTTPTPTSSSAPTTVTTSTAPTGMDGTTATTGIHGAASTTGAATTAVYLAQTGVGADRYAVAGILLLVLGALVLVGLAKRERDSGH